MYDCRIDRFSLNISRGVGELTDSDMKFKIFTRLCYAMNTYFIQ